MSSRNFGNYLKELRAERNMTLKEVADGICSVRQLQRIERNENDPSLFLLNGLGMKLNINLSEIYTRDFIINGDSCHQEILNIDRFIRSQSIKELRQYISALDTTNYRDNPFFIQVYEYALALCSLTLDNDYVAASYHINKGLEQEFPISKRHKICNYRFSNTGYTLLNLQASILYRQGHYQESITLCSEIKQSLEHFFFSEANECIITAKRLFRLRGQERAAEKLQLYEDGFTSQPHP